MYEIRHFINSAMVTKLPMTTVGIGFFAISFIAEVSMLHAGHAGKARSFFRDAEIAWIASLVCLAANGIFFGLRKQKRFLLFGFVGLLILLSSAYVKDGGESTPLPYSANQGRR